MIQPDTYYYSIIISHSYSSLLLHPVHYFGLHHPQCSTFRRNFVFKKMPQHFPQFIVPKIMEVAEILFSRKCRNIFLNSSFHQLLLLHLLLIQLFHHFRLHALLFSSRFKFLSPQVFVCTIVHGANFILHGRAIAKSQTFIP
jgi:hypothetical protein